MNPAIICALICSVLITPFARSAEQASPEQVRAIKRMELLDNQERLIPGDAVEIRIVEDKREALTVLVGQTGEITVPYAGLMKVTGLTCRETAFRCKAALEKNFFRTATVLVAIPKGPIVREPPTCTWHEFVVVYGNVSKPGKYDLPDDRDLTITDLLQRAGGHQSERAVPKIEIIRKTPQGNKRILVHAQAILKQKHSQYDLFLRGSDIVIVK